MTWLDDCVVSNVPVTILDYKIRSRLHSFAYCQNVTDASSKRHGLVEKCTANASTSFSQKRYADTMSTENCARLDKTSNVRQLSNFRH